MQRTTRLVVSRPGAKLTKAEKKRISLSAHVQFAIRTEARREGIIVSATDVDRQLHSWGLAPSMTETSRAHGQDQLEQTMALRDVAETQLLFQQLAEKAGDPKKAYQATIDEYAKRLPETKFSLKEIAKAAPTLLGAVGGSRGT